MATVQSNRRAQGPMPVGLVVLMSTILCVAIVTVWYFMFYEGNPNTGADQNQITQLQGFVDQIKATCASDRIMHFTLTILPQRGVVFLRDIPLELKDKIRGAGCEQYCLCAIKRESDGVGALETRKLPPQGGYFARATFLSTKGESSQLKDFLVEPTTKVLRCFDVQKATKSKSDAACFKDVVLRDNAWCSGCADVGWTPKQMKNYWGLPLYWETDYRKLAIFRENCAWRTGMTVKVTDNALFVDSHIFNNYVSEIGGSKGVCVAYPCNFVACPLNPDACVNANMCTY